jgi:hypothetical protein
LNAILYKLPFDFFGDLGDGGEVGVEGGGDGADVDVLALSAS